MVQTPRSVGHAIIDCLDDVLQVHQTCHPLYAVSSRPLALANLTTVRMVPRHDQILRFGNAERGMYNSWALFEVLLTLLYRLLGAVVPEPMRAMPND